jgi:hypothetical protein
MPQMARIQKLGNVNIVRAWSPLPRKFHVSVIHVIMKISVRPDNQIFVPIEYKSQ